MKDGKTIACLGGTFNRLHAGHRLLIKTAFDIADLVYIGVTSDSLVRRLRREHAAEVRPFADRAGSLRRLLAGYPEERYTVAPLDDPYVPAQREEFDVIVVSPETRKTAEEINALRDLRGYPSIKIVEVPWLKAFDGEPISSSRILRGEIDEEGRSPGAAAKEAAAPPAEAPPPPAPAPLLALAPTAKTEEAPAPSAPKARPHASARKKPKRAPKKRRAIGKKAAAKPSRGRSKVRKGSRAAGPRSRR